SRCPGLPNYYVVRDADGQQIAYVYYSNDPERRSAAKLARELRGGASIRRSLLAMMAERRFKKSRLLPATTSPAMAAATTAPAASPTESASAEAASAAPTSTPAAPSNLFKSNQRC